MMSSVGSIGGGLFPMYYINKGYEPYAGRMKAMLAIAVLPLAVLSAQYLGVYSYWFPVVIIGIGTAAHQAWSANIFTTVSDMFPNKAVASVTGIGGMAGAIGGIVVNKSAGWLFDFYRSAGIAKSWIAAQSQQLGDYAEKIRSLKLVNKHGDLLNLNTVELGNLPKEVITQLQAVDPGLFDQIKHIQAPIVQSHMTTAYTIVFAFCATAYLMAWFVMHTLVPKFKKIDL
jgi:ACS family hexuronate transporter-like MFS transporter